MNKDLFSGHSDVYAAFRPTYPEALYDFIFSFVQDKQVAWDCGTGNGQVAQRLAKDFQMVYATDLSENQLKKAAPAENIVYSRSAAETTAFPDRSFDLITVGQALHWFNIEQFYKEVRRVARPDSVVAVWGYGNILVNAQLDPLISDFYTNVVGKYWDAARRHVENEYVDIPFPFRRIDAPRFYIQQEWPLQHLSGYLESWSATQKYNLDTGENPVQEFKKILAENWGNSERLTVRFPIFLKLGVV
jgi:SAM-dependent methyltransferase